MAKNNKKKKKGDVPEYVARESVWFTMNGAWWLPILIIAGLGAFAFLQFLYLPTAAPDLAGILNIVSIVGLATGIVCFFILFFKIIGRPKFEFYSNRVVEKKGIFQTVAQEGVFIGIYTVTISQSFLGSVFRYGDVIVDYPGYWDLKTRGLANPYRLVNYLHSRMTTRGLGARIANTAPVADLQLY